MSPGRLKAEHSTTLDALAEWITRHSDAGSDPYDGLNSPFARAAGFFGRWGRLAYMQAIRRSPFDLRRVLFIPPGTNPKAKALLAQAYLALHQGRGGERYLDEARKRIQWLEENAARAGDWLGWGYHFDWAARAFFIPKGTPTVVNTATAGKAFLLAHRLTGEARYLETARRAARFVLSGLNRAETEQGLCFSYTPLDHSRVYNASLLGASLLAQVGAALGGDRECLDPARSALRFVLVSQNTDGSWPYGAAPFHSWIDGHHTGFILRDLGEIRAATGWDEISAPLRRGAEFYDHRLVTAEGRPLFRLDRPWPADIHACAEAILVFSDPNLREFFDAPMDRALQTASWTTENLRRPDGTFGYLKFPNRTDWTPHMRWGQAWMLLALARLESALAADGREAAAHAHLD